MTTVDLLSRVLPRKIAAIVTGLWYALLIALIFFATYVPSGRFVYDSL